MKTNVTFPYPKTGGNRSSALVVVLCFVVLMAALVLLLMTRSMTNGMISQASANVSKTDLYGHGAVEQIIGDLEQEIVAGSKVASVTPSTGGPASLASPAGIYTNSTTGVISYIYRPAAPINAVPALQGANTNSWNTSLPNLVKESTYNVPFYPATGYDPNAPSRAAKLSTDTTTVSTEASYVGSVTGESRNGRYISAARWNKHLLLPKATPAGTKTDPISGNSGFVAPDWILTPADGSIFSSTTLDTSSSLTTSNINSKSSKYVVGRYAYAIYNEGGLLDANVAGGPGPSSMSAAQKLTWSKKGPAAFADLTKLPGIASVSSPQKVVDQLVSWRNYATTQPSSSFPNYIFGNIDNYFNYLLSLSTSFMTTGNTSLSPSGQSDRLFTTRQQLISFLHDVVNGNTADEANLQNAMMYLGTFTRTLNQPSYWPDPNRPTVQGADYPPSYNNGNTAYKTDNTYNPPFKSIRVGASWPGTRNDGTAWVQGEPLVKKRFALSRLCWLTYKGPSASLYASSPSDPAITQLLQDGVPLQLIKEGTSGPSGNIYKYFGLTWSPGPGTGGIGGYWKYDPDNEGAPPSGIIIKTLNQVAALKREPNFFELLKAGVCSGSVALATYVSTSGLNPGAINLDVQIKEDNRVDFQILQMGVNIMSQASPTNFPTSVTFYDAGGANASYRSFIGVDDLPYIYGLYFLYALNKQPSPAAPPDLSPQPIVPPLINPGLIGEVQVPVVWNPHTLNPTSLPAGLYPTAFRIGVSNLVPKTMATPPPGIPATNFRYDTHYQDGNSSKPVPGYDPARSPWSPDTIPSYPYAPAVLSSSVNPTPIDPNTGLLIFPGPGASYNTEIYFDLVGNNALYREPTALVYTTSSGSGNVHLDSQNVMSTVGGFPSSGISDVQNNSGSYIGFFVSECPFRWVDTDSAANTQKIYTVNNIGNGNETYGNTYSIEYQAPGGGWIPYKQYNITEDNGHWPTSGSGYTSLSAMFPSPLSEWVTPNERTGMMSWDPRTQRWGIVCGGADPPAVITPNPLPVMQTARPSTALGQVAHGRYFGAPSKDMYLGRTETPFTNTSNYITDPDKVVRRPMGAYVPGNQTATITTGMPMANVSQNAATNGSNRPIILHRPFRSVSELSYAFSDIPWKNIDFFTPESGDSALLDVFCINEDYRSDALSAGRVDLNTKQAPVIQALLTGAYRDEFDTASSTILSSSSPSEASTIAQALVTRTTSTTSGKGPLTNIGDLVGRYTSGFSANANGFSPYDGFSRDLSIYPGGASSGNNIIQRFREATMRALSDAGQAGTWNLLIDVVAQSGRYPIDAKNLSDFLVEGERHYWVHLAIDRTTGQVIDENIEVVNE